MLRRRLEPPRDVFPVNDWALEVVALPKGLTAQYLGQSETMFALANGFLGIRGTPEEDHPVMEPGTYLNGFYELRPIVYGEHAYGFPNYGQTILNCPNGKIVKLFVDDEAFDLESSEIVSYHRKLDLRTGTITRDVVFAAASGKLVRMASRRLVSFCHRDLIALRFEVTVEGADAEVVLASELINRQPLAAQTSDPRIGQGFVGRVLHPTGTETIGLRAILSYRTQGSQLLLGCGMDHVVTTDCPHVAEVRCDDDLATVVVRVDAKADRPVCLDKYLSYHYAAGAEPHDLRLRTAWTLDRAVEDGFVGALDEHTTYVQGFWARADIEVQGGQHEEKQQVIRWNLFQLLQATARADGHGVPARGLTGQTYEGHYFWDGEIYVLPFLIYSDPHAARNLLKHRYDRLDRARARARELDHQGATFPWRTINGEEASAYYAAGTAQYHINADIMYGLRKYVEVTGDEEFLEKYGAEMLVETARFWRDLGYYSRRDGRQFRINGVTGPDEYTAVVNNNFFTNLMAQENLRYAARTLRWLERDHDGAFQDLRDRLGLEQHEVASWEEAADRMYLPYDPQLGIHPQDDSFLDKEMWDFAGTPEDKYPLLLHYHPLNLYRHQVIKQADTLLAMFLHGDRFSVEAKKRNFDYYDPLTTHDSSLSVCIQSIMAAEIGYMEKAREYFDFAAVMDLADVGGNVMHGAHIASIGGSWMALVYGFGGLRDFGGRITFAPRLPAGWQHLRFPLRVRGNFLRIEVRPRQTTYRLVEGERLLIAHEGEELELNSGRPQITCANRPIDP